MHTKRHCNSAAKAALHSRVVDQYFQNIFGAALEQNRAEQAGTFCSRSDQRWGGTD